MKKKKAKAKSRAAKRSDVMSPQWEKVYRFREQLKTQYPPPPMRRLRSIWEQIQDEQPLRSPEESEFSSPLEALMFCIRDGRYPPPEILLSLHESWSEYLQAAGSQSLDDALIFKPTRKGGNFARRALTRNQKLSQAILLLAIRREDVVKQNRAAEIAVDRFELEIEPETLIRNASSVTNESVRRVSAGESSVSAAATAKLFLRRKRKSAE